MPDPNEAKVWKRQDVKKMSHTVLWDNPYLISTDGKWLQSWRFVVLTSPCPDANFKGADMTNSTIESVDFDGADLTDAVLIGAQVAPLMELLLWRIDAASLFDIG